MTDLRYAFRMLRRSPGFTAVAVLTLALGIGANTAMFSVVNAVLLKALEYRHPEQLVILGERNSVSTLPNPVAYLHWREQRHLFSYVAAAIPTGEMNLTGTERAERLQASLVSANYFDLLGVPPALGRAFLPGEDQPGRDRVAVLSNRLWRRLGADSSIIGKDLLLNGEKYTVAGVMPAGGIFDRGKALLWAPLALKPDRIRVSTQFFRAIARLQPGVTLAQARAEIERVTPPEVRSGGAKAGITVEPLRNWLVQEDLRRILLVLLGAVGFVLLIGCTNVAGLMLARGAARAREVAVRAALGAGRLRLARLFLAESLLLALAGGLLGLLLAGWILDAVTALLPAGAIPQETVARIDVRVLLFTLGASVLSAVLFGLAPALASSRIHLAAALKQSATGLSHTGAHVRSRSVLVVAEVALAVVLVVGSGLLLRSLLRLLQVDPGFQRERILTAKTLLPELRFRQAHQLLAYQDDILRRMQSIAGVKAAAFTNALPMDGMSYNTDFRIDGLAARRVGGPLRAVSRDYIRAAGIELLEGRWFSPDDTERSPGVAVVNRSLARRYFPDGGALGRVIRYRGSGFENKPFSIVGVIADVRHQGLVHEPMREVYLLSSQIPPKALEEGWGRRLYFVVRAAGDLKALVPALVSVAAAVDKDQPLYDIKTMERVFTDSIARPRFHAVLFGAFGGLALSLAAVGLYGLLSYSVSQRTREIGIRMALGGQARTIVAMVLGQGLLLAALGIALGVGGALALTRLLAAFLFGVTPTDRLTFIAVGALLALVALAACYIPARRAARVDPMVALRYE